MSIKYLKITTLLLSGFIFFASHQTFGKSSSAKINIDQSFDKPVVVAVVPFRNSGGKVASKNIRDLINKNLSVSGLINTIKIKKMLSFPSKINQIAYSNWKINQAEYLVIGNVFYDKSKKKFKATIHLIDLLQKKIVTSFTAHLKNNEFNVAANKITNSIFKNITGIKGIFESKFSFVEEKKVLTRSGMKRKFSLKITDINGSRPKTIFSSFQPVMSLSWSHDNSKIAYVTFEDDIAFVRIYNIKSKITEDIRVPGYMASSPAWSSKDNNEILITLNRKGNAEIAVLNLKTKRITKITNNRAIDTEGSWSYDMKKVVFTSDRFGRVPQILEYDMATKSIVRLTDDLKYNARPRYIDNDSIIFIRKQKRKFDLYTMNLNLNTMKRMTFLGGVKSVSVSPNQRYVVFVETKKKTSTLKIMHLKSKTVFPFAKTRNTIIREASWSSL